MFTTTERETFARQGLIKRENFLPVEKVDAARQVIFHQLAQAGLRRNGGWALDKARPATELTAGMALVKPLDHHPAIMALASEEAPAAASALVDGRPLFPMGRHPGLLFAAECNHVDTSPSALAFGYAPPARGRRAGCADLCLLRYR